MGTYVVTGGAGFIGSHLCDRLLAEGHHVVAIDDLSSGSLANLAEARASGGAFTLYNVDIRADGFGAILARHAPDVVVHLAERPEDAAAPEAASVGVVGLLAVLQASAAASVRKLVLGSSASVYGAPRTVPAKEAAIPRSRPLSASAATLRLAEEYLRFYAGGRGLDFVSVVLAEVYGPRQATDRGGSTVASAAAAILSNLHLTLPGARNDTRDFLFVDDAVHALALAADRGSGRTLNVGTGVETSLGELWRLLGEITGRMGPEPAFQADPRRPGRICLDSEAARRHLGWKPWTHLEDGLRETVAYLKGS